MRNLIILLSLLAFSDHSSAAVKRLEDVIATKATIDNVRIDGNTVSTIDTNGNLVLTPNGTGKVRFSSGTVSTVPYLDASKDLISSSVTPTELGYLSGVTSAIQTQMNLKAPLANPTFTGTVTGTFSGNITGAVTGNASTATALAANPADCSSNQFANAIAASGALTCAQPAFTDISGVATIANGGTNNGSLAVTAGGVFYSDGSKFVNVGAGTSGQFLKSNGASAPTWATAAGDVVGPGSATDTAVALYVGTTGKLLKNSSVKAVNLPKTVAAYISYSGGTPAVTQEKGGDWISSITDGGAGLPQLNLTGSFFSTAPICTCSCEENVSSGQACMVNSFSTSSVFVRTRDLASGLIDGNFHIICTEWF